MDSNKAIVRQIRRENIRTLADSFDTQKDFALAVGIPKNHVNDILHERRYVGDGISRRIEINLGLAAGALDIAQLS